MCAFDFGAIIVSPVAGFIPDRVGNPISIFIFSCILRVVACVVYRVNLSAYFPLLGRLFSRLTGMGNAILYAQIVLQTNEESRGGSFVLVETVCCVGVVFGPVIGSVRYYISSECIWLENRRGKFIWYYVIDHMARFPSLKTFG